MYHSQRIENKKFFPVTNVTKCTLEQKFREGLSKIESFVNLVPYA